LSDVVNCSHCGDKLKVIQTRTQMYQDHVTTWRRKTCRNERCIFGGYVYTIELTAPSDMKIDYG